MGRRAQAVEFFKAVGDLEAKSSEILALECLNEGFVYIYDGLFE
jgi:hypothetical protein